MTEAMEGRNHGNLFYIFQKDKQAHPMPPERAAKILENLKRYQQTILPYGGINNEKENLVCTDSGSADDPDCL